MSMTSGEMEGWRRGRPTPGRVVESICGLWMGRVTSKGESIEMDEDGCVWRYIDTDPALAVVAWFAAVILPMGVQR